MRAFLLAAFVLGVGFHVSPWGSAWAKPTGVTHACTSRESWEFPQEFPQKWKTKYLRFLKDENSVEESNAIAFSDALALRAAAEDSYTKKFAEFWIARVLWSSKLSHSALGGFKNVLLSQENSPNSDRSIRLAALECWVSIQSENPSVPIDPEVYKAVLTLSDGNPGAPKLAAAFYIFGMQAGKNPAIGVIGDSLVLVAKRDPVYGPLLTGLNALKRGAIADSLAPLNVALQSNALAPEFSAHVRILLARAYFSTKKFQEAWGQLRLIPRNSPLFTTALTDLAWTALDSGRYPEAVGVALSLQSSAFKGEFIPDAALVLAIAFNELCHYPAALQAVQNFKTRYAQDFEWLQTQGQGGGGPSLYSLAITRTEGKASAPETLVRQWMRMPAFMTSQREINALFEEDSTGSAFKDDLEEERGQNRLAIHNLANSVRPQLALDPKSASAPLVQKSMAELRARVVEYLNQKRAGALWNVISAASRRSANGRRKELVAQIDQQIRKENAVLLSQLKEAAQSLRLVEIEIFNGASHDMIFMNAHPDYSTTLAKWIEPPSKDQGEKKWLWGSLPTEPDARVEIWADELGSIRANLPDHCTNKDKYLALKSVK